MKKILTTFFLLISTLLVINTADATTYYIRTDGGTSTQCTGTTNAAYPGTGTAQACAYSHPAWATGAGTVGGETAAKIVGGDTLIINAGAYMVGVGMPNTTGCSLFSPYLCTLRPIPSGTVSNPTKILGSAYNTGCATKPELWGTESTGDGNRGILTLTGASNVEIQCLEITDHSTCGFRVGATPCSENYNIGTSSGTYSRGAAITAHGGSNFVLKNIDIHGMSSVGLAITAVNNLTLSHINIDGSHSAGWNGAYLCAGAGCYSDAMSGNIYVDHVKTRFSGCREAYPRSGSFTVNDYTDCVSAPYQGQYADGWGFADTYGNWIITDSEWSHNTEDGLDLLYGHNMTVNIDRSLFEGNGGNQLKVTATTFNLTNSILIGNCNYFSLTGKYVGGDQCRAGGVPLALTPELGSVYKVTNNIITSATDSESSSILEISDRNGTCSGTETYTLKNNIFYSVLAGTGWSTYYSALTGACSTAFAARTTTYSKIYRFSDSPSGTGNTYTAPSWVSALSNSAASNVANVYLSSNVGGGNASTYWNTSNDYNNYPQNGTIDQGAIQYGSSLQLQQSGQSCVAATDCSSGTCTSFACSGSCTANGGVCATGATCCSGTCTALVCANPVTCGDSTIQTPEVCDTANLNGSNCILQGFTGGTLTCASNCLSFVTAACTNTLVFPLTPILDDFNRANVGPPPSSNWTTDYGGGFKVLSNVLVLNDAGPTISGMGWNKNQFGPDMEAYVTIPSVTTPEFNLRVDVRVDNQYHNGYDILVDSLTDTIIVNEIASNGNETQLGSTISQVISAGDSVGLSIVGSTITVYYKAAAGSWTSKGTRSDSSHTGAGIIALELYQDSTGITLDNFGGGSLNPVTCGNGLKETGEVCDGADLSGQSCPSQGYASGTLTCATNCQSFVTSSCVTASTCGNNTKQVGELCDGTDLNSNTCVTQGFASGTLACNSNCLSFVTTGCVATNIGTSGGVVLK